MVKKNVLSLPSNGLKCNAEGCKQITLLFVQKTSRDAGLPVAGLPANQRESELWGNLN